MTLILASITPRAFEPIVFVGLAACAEVPSVVRIAELRGKGFAYLKVE